jgi:hypothetical protein
MLEIGMSGLMSGERKRAIRHRASPRLYPLRDWGQLIIVFSLYTDLIVLLEDVFLQE